MRKFSKFGEDHFQYINTVFVFGDLNAYVKELEEYFRSSQSDLDDGLRYRTRKLEQLTKDVERMQKNEFLARVWDTHDYGCPFSVSEDNWEEAKDWLEDRGNYVRKICRLQRINQGKLMEVIHDEDQIDSLDLTNLAYNDHVIRIQYALTQDFPFREDGTETIRMRVYSTDPRTDMAESFARKVNYTDNVKAMVIPEEKVDELPSLESLMKPKTRRSTLRVRMPVFELDQLTYSCTLSNAEMEMLKILGQCFQSPDSLYYASPTWSPEQGKKLVRNLFGIVGLEDRGRHRYSWYSHFFVDKSNREAVQKALNDGGVFRKTIDSESLPVLSAIHNRTIELREKYGWNFYPRFTIKEVSERTGLSKQKTKKCIQDLVGILATVMEPCMITTRKGDIRSSVQYKWFIPQSRNNLVWELMQ